MEKHGVSFKFLGVKDCNVAADLEVVQFWLLYVLTVCESSAIKEGSLGNSREPISSQKEGYIVGRCTIACQDLPCIAVSTMKQQRI